MRLEHMATRTLAVPDTTVVQSLSNWVPVEVEERDSAGNAWVKLADQWSRIDSMENLWELDGEWQGSRPIIRLHFNAVVEGHRRIALYQDLVEGSWYRRVALSD
jgi:hypothetical protein